MAVVLLAEDERAIRDLLVMTLKRAGHEVLTAANGLEAVALFRSYAKSIDVVVTDVVMPVMDGIQAILRIRESRPDAKIICMTGYATTEIPQGVQLLSKPFLPTELIKKIEEIAA